MCSCSYACISHSAFHSIQHYLSRFEIENKKARPWIGRWCGKTRTNREVYKAHKAKDTWDSGLTLNIFIYIYIYICNNIYIYIIIYIIIYMIIYIIIYIYISIYILSYLFYFIYILLLLFILLLCIYIILYICILSYMKYIIFYYIMDFPNTLYCSYLLEHTYDIMQISSFATNIIGNKRHQSGIY